MDLLKEYYEKFKKLDAGEREYEKCNYEFLNENLPRFSCSVKELEEIYYFRAYTLSKHIKKNSAGKYIVTEFLNDVSWAIDTEGAISCPVGHQLSELRWFKNCGEIVKQYADFWLNHIEKLLVYNNWFCYAFYEYAEYTNCLDYAYSVADKLIEYFTLFESRNKAKCGLYKGTDNYDGMELSISSSGIRPTINSYVYANAYGIYKILESHGDERADYYKNFCENLKKEINGKLYVNDLYYNLPVENGETIDRFYPDFSNPHPDHAAKELSAYTPFYFGIPQEENAGCLKFLTDEKIFKQKYGLATADQSNPLYKFPFPHACLWNGPVWPFATSQVLRGVSEWIKVHGEKEIGGSDFADMLITYAKSQHITIEGEIRPWIDEDLDGTTGEWLARRLIVEYGRDDVGRGKDYNHSAFIDHVINGLCGVCVNGGKTDFKPILSDKIASFSLEGVVVGGKAYNVKYAENKYVVTEA